MAGSALSILIPTLKSAWLLHHQLLEIGAFACTTKYKSLLIGPLSSVLNMLGLQPGLWGPQQARLTHLSREAQISHGEKHRKEMQSVLPHWEKAQVQRPSGFPKPIFRALHDV